MALTPQMIAEANKITGNNISPTGQAPVVSRSEQIRQIAAKAKAAMPKETEGSGIFNTPKFGEKNTTEKATDLKKAGEGVTNFFTGSTQKFGKTSGEAIAAPKNTKLYEESLKSHQGISDSLKKHIADMKSAGQDTSKLEATLASHETSKPELKQFTGDVVDKTTGDVMKEAGGTLLEAGTVPEVETLGKITAGAGKIIEKTGEKLYGKAIPLSANEAKMLQTYKADKPLLERIGDWMKGTSSKPRLTSETALDKNLMGTKSAIGVQAKRASDKLWSNLIKPALKKTPALVTKEDLFSPIEKRISETVEPAKKQAFLDAFEALKSEYKNINHLTLEDAQKVKQELDKFTPDKVFKGKPIANEYKTLQNDMANSIRQKIYDALGDDVKQAYLDYGNLNGLKEFGQKAMTGEKLKGGAGTFISEIASKAVTPVATVGGMTVYKVGQGLEFIGKAGAKTLGDIIGGSSFRLSK